MFPFRARLEDKRHQYDHIEVQEEAVHHSPRIRADRIDAGGFEISNVNRGKLTEKVNDEEIDSSARAAAHASKRLDRTGSGHSTRLKKGETGQTSGGFSKGRTTESLSTNVGEVDIEERRSTAVLSQNRVTDVLGEERKTDVLSEAPGTAVLTETQGTAVLSETRQTEILADNMATEGRAGTTVLSETEELTQEGVMPVAFNVTKSVIMIHTDEVI